MSNQNGGAETNEPPKKRFENSIVGFTLGIAIAAVAGAFVAYSWVRSEIDRQVDDRLTISLPSALRSDPEIEILRDQRKEIRDAQGELAQFRSDTGAFRDIVKVRLEDSVAEAQAAREQALQAASALQGRIRELNETVDASRVLARIDARADKALEGLDDKLVSRLEFPADAVVAFAVARPEGVEANGPTDDPCPTGWSRYRDADGRFIVGIGPEDNPFKQAGARTHPLRPAEIPSHTHGLNLDSKDYKFDQFGANFIRFNVTTGGKTAAAVPDDKPPQAHENMPPYIALYFCKKGG